MQQMIPAAQPQQKFRPQFYVTKLEGEYPVKVYHMEEYGKPDKNGEKKHRLVMKEEMRKKGWLVTFPKPRPEHVHSVHIATIEEMEAYGFTATEVPLIDNEGEVVGAIPNAVRKEKKDA